MFKNPFSFKGRIRRSEYAISIFVSPFVLGVIAIFSEFFIHGDFVFLFSFIAFFWFNLSQGTKRCHDLNESGIMQIIPFYGFVMLFKEGTPNDNRYGSDPTVPDYKIEKATNNINVDESFIIIVQRVLPFAILNALFIAILLKFVTFTPFLNLAIFGSIVISFFILLMVHKEQFKYSVWNKLIFALLSYLCIRIYVLVFLDYSLFLLSLLFEITLVIISFSLSYISSYLYHVIFKKTLK